MLKHNQFYLSIFVLNLPVCDLNLTKTILIFNVSVRKYFTQKYYHDSAGNWSFHASNVFLRGVSYIYNRRRCKPIVFGKHILLLCLKLRFDIQLQK